MPVKSNEHWGLIYLPSFSTEIMLKRPFSDAPTNTDILDLDEKEAPLNQCSRSLSFGSNSIFFVRLCNPLLTLVLVLNLTLASDLGMNLTLCDVWLGAPSVKFSIRPMQIYSGCHCHDILIPGTFCAPGTVTNSKSALTGMCISARSTHKFGR
jgi:hypothetical protein